MRKQIQLIIAGFSLAMAASSCKKDFLKVDLFQRIEAKNTADYEQLINSKGFYNYPEDGGPQAAVILGLEMAAEQTYFAANNTAETQHLFNWDDMVYQPDVEAKDLKYFLNNIYVCNKIINEVADAEGGTPALKSQLAAEAKATRAWVHFQLNNLYAMPYQAASANSDLALPYITTADMARPLYERVTVQQAYDLMIADVTAAIPSLPLNQTYNTRMTKAAAEALLGKLYVFMGKYTDALTHFNNAFAFLQQMTKAARLYDYNTEQADGTSPNDFTESVLGKSFWAGQNPWDGIGSGGLVITPATQALYGASDLRLQYYTADLDDWTPNPTGRLRRSLNTYVKFGMELPDLYLLRAECEARLNSLPAAVADVQALRTKRMPAADAAVPAAVAADQSALVRFIIDERTREFAAEGYCWADNRRLYGDPLFSNVNYVHYAYNDDGTTTAITLRKQRLALRLPQLYINMNPGMANNP